MSETRNEVSPSHDDNLEIFSLIWLDTQVNTTEENRQTHQELRQIINHLVIFDDQQQCHRYILSLSIDDRLILIVSGQLGRQLIPQIHHLRQLSSIYIFCKDEQVNKQWAKHFPKVRNVFVRKADLLHQMTADHRPRVKLEEPLSIEIYYNDHNLDQSTTSINGYCVHSLLLIDVLLRMKPIESDKHQLIKLCKDIYRNNPTQLALVHQFDRDYTPSKALWWYTRESFVYSMLNKALRVQNIDLLCLFRFFIQDLDRSLQQNQCQSSVHVYRGQVVSSDELQVLQRSKGRYISNTSFFSTSIKRHKALEFMRNSSISNDLRRILFIIDADPRVVKSQPFAHVTSFSDVYDELEVLFMIGCVFRLTEIKQNKDNIWEIRLQLCDDDQHDLKTLFNHMKKEYGCGENEVSLQSLGDVLYRMGKYDSAEKIYNRLLGKLSPNDPSFAHLYYSFGLIGKDRNEYDLSLDCFRKSLEITMQTNPSDYIYIGGLYDCIGNIQLEKGNDDEAIQCYNQAIEWYDQVDDGNIKQLMAAIYHGMGNLYVHQKNYSEALMYYVRAFSLQVEHHLRSDHPDMAMILDSIGTVHRHLGQYHEAENYHNRSLQIREKSLPPLHQDMAKSFRSFGLLYESLRRWEQAWSNYQKAAKIYRHALSPKHPDALELQKDIQRVSSYMI